MKRFALLLSVFIITAILFGCQATPGKPTVIGKDQEQMLERARDEKLGNEPLSEVKTSERYQTRVVSEKGDVTVNVDAEITYPKADSIPIIKVKRAGYLRRRSTG